MYWKVGINEDNWIIYNYFEIVPRSVLSHKPFYNPITKLISYPVNYDLIIKASKAETELAFEVWWHNHNPLRKKYLE